MSKVHARSCHSAHVQDMTSDLDAVISQLLHELNCVLNRYVLVLYSFVTSSVDGCSAASAEWKGHHFVGGGWTQDQI